jgi:RNA polymerase sigma factor (sigma-70 family)
MLQEDHRRRRNGQPKIARRCAVQRARQGDQQAWNELVSRYAGLVRSVARAHRLHAADAADVAQVTWMKLVEHLGDIHEPAALGGWLATTARRECLRLLRRDARTVLSDNVPDAVAAGDDVDERLLTSEQGAELRRAFSRLRARDQALLRMLAADPAPSYQQISVTLEMPIGSIGPTRARALERLRREVDRLAPVLV